MKNPNPRILQPKSTYTVDYPKAIELAEMQDGVFWPAREIDVAGDVQDLRVNFTEAERHATLTALKLFTLYELKVGNDFWSGYIKRKFPRPDIMRMADCLAKDTRFITSRGVKSFADFKAGDEITVLTHTGKWQKAKVKCYGMANTNKITICRGSGKTRRVLEATSNHRWLLDNGQVTSKLAVGDTLLPPPDLVRKWKFEKASPEEKKMWCLGFAFGDGNSYDNGHGVKYGRVQLCGAKTAHAGKFIDAGYSVVAPSHFKGDLKVNLGQYVKKIPKFANRKERAAFVYGYCDADAGKNSVNSKYSSIQATGAGAISFIRKNLPVAGVYLGNSVDLTGQQTNYTVRTRKTENFKVSTNQDKYKWKVESIVPGTKQEVWCLEVEQDHSFVLESGIVTGNCFAFFETNVHAPFYNKINEELLVATDEFYNSYVEDKVLRERMEFIDSLLSDNSDNPLDIARNVAGISMVEGGVLYANFGLLKHFQARGKNKAVNVVSGVNFSVRDENIHSLGGAWLFRTLIEEIGPSEMEMARLTRDILEIGHVIRSHEHLIIDKFYERGPLDLDKGHMKTFMDSRVNLCISQLGIKKVPYEVTENPVADWFYRSITGTSINDFFNRQGNQYNRNWNPAKFVMEPLNPELDVIPSQQPSAYNAIARILDAKQLDYDRIFRDDEHNVIQLARA